ncbi:hypothetical protein ACGFWD_33915 [Streptomyces sp. NPDC048448]|uniref:hypothetical protein n=1 Tax=Streptomyces sp. NPDC048448 TaxID=3365554 RepID=UPI00371A0758
MQLTIHLDQVCASLEDVAEELLVYGPQAKNDLARLLSKIIVRASEGRWHALLDEVDLSDRARGLSASVIGANENRADIRVAAIGVAAGILLTVAAFFLGMPPGLALGIGSIGATVPALFSGRLNVNPVNFLQNSRQAVAPEPQAASESGQ